jgi:hypothetical protein
LGSAREQANSIAAKDFASIDRAAFNFTEIVQEAGEP